MRVMVTGSEGFVGANLCAALEAREIDVTRWDVTLGETFDLTAPQGLRYALLASDAVVHLAANADVRGGWAKPGLDLQQNVVATANLLEAMRVCSVRRLVLASSNAVYARGGLPTTEWHHVRPESLYGASKVAAEAFASAYAAAGHLDVSVLRFVPMLGPGYHHGLIADFVQKLRVDPSRLEVIPGPRRQYLDVDDAITAILCVLDRDLHGFDVCNVAGAESVDAVGMARLVGNVLGLDPEIVPNGERWPGDLPINLDCGRLHGYGWSPRQTLRESVARTVEGL